MTKLGPSLCRRTSPSASNVDAWMRGTPRMNFHHWRKTRREERRQRGRCAVVREASFLGDGGGHGRPQGSSGCDGQLLDLRVQTSDHPLHRLTTLWTDMNRSDWADQLLATFLTKFRRVTNQQFWPICEPFDHWKELSHLKKYIYHAKPVGKQYIAQY